MNALATRIARLIAAQGPISVAQFMTMALHDPQAGYYATRDPFGARGDFITAPEISQMFGELLGLWIAQSWLDQKKPVARLVELGPGRGTLMSDALRAVSRLVPEFLERVEIVLVENSHTLRDLQQTMLGKKNDSCGAAENAEEKPGLGVSAPPRANLSWLDAFDDSLTDKPLFLLANEFFDALPVRQFVKTERGWCERMVVLDAHGVLAFALAPEAVPLTAIPANRHAAPIGAFYETSPASTALAQQIGEIVAQKGGAALIVDYGYGADAGFGETLQAVSAHKYASLLEAPGDADLSAHVDFSALADAARAGGASVCGPVGQGDFLISLGIVSRAERLASGGSQGRSVHPHLGSAPDIERQLDRLVQPDQMGTLFKALAIMPRGKPAPGF